MRREFLIDLQSILEEPAVPGEEFVEPYPCRKYYRGQAIQEANIPELYQAFKREYYAPYKLSLNINES